MNGKRDQPTRWFGALQSEGSTELSTPIAEALITTRRFSLGRLVLGVGGSLALPVVLGVVGFGLDVEAFKLLCFLAVFAGPILAATALIKYGEIAWRYRGVRAGNTVERFTGRAPLGFDDTVTKRLRKRNLINDEGRHTLLVDPESGVVLAVDDAASQQAVRGTITETAPLRAADDLQRPLDALERAELAGVMHRMQKLPVGNSVALGWVAALILRRYVWLSDGAARWFGTRGWIIWFGIAAVLLVVARLNARRRIADLRNELHGPLHALPAGDCPGSMQPIAGFPRSDVVWQCGAYPGPARLEGGGLRGKVAHKARG